MTRVAAFVVLASLVVPSVALGADSMACERQVQVLTAAVNQTTVNASGLNYALAEARVTIEELRAALAKAERERDALKKPEAAKP